MPIKASRFPLDSASIPHLSSFFPERGKCCTLSILCMTFARTKQQLNARCPQSPFLVAPQENALIKDQVWFLCASWELQMTYASRDSTTTGKMTDSSLQGQDRRWKEGAFIAATRALGSERRPVMSYLYSSENLVSSLLSCSHLNSRGQLPSAMQVRTKRFPSRWTWVRTGSVLKYGETSSAKTRKRSF